MSKKHLKTNQKSDTSPAVPQREKIKDKLSIKEFNFTDKQKQLIDLILEKHTKIVFIDGPAGTGKSLISVYAALKLLNEKRISDIVFVRTLIESASKTAGYLPGFLEDKFKPFLMPLEDKLNELLSRGDTDRLFKENRIQPIPINYLRGASFNAKCVWGEECQNFTFKELTTLITRIGQFSKFILCGDSRQKDINGNSGFERMMQLFDNEESRGEGIHCFYFTREDVMRSGVLKFILEKLEDENAKK